MRKLNWVVSAMLYDAPQAHLKLYSCTTNGGMDVTGMKSAKLVKVLSISSEIYLKVHLPCWTDETGDIPIYRIA